MLLKYSLTDSSHQPVEQLMFTALDIQPAAADAASAPVAAAVPPPELAAASASVPKAADGKDEDAKEDHDDAWKFGTLPAGFQQTKNLLEKGKDGKPPVRQIILSDGMTSVSVFIPQSEGGASAEVTEYSSGAMNIFTKQVDKHTVTLVGEVPVATLESIGESLKYDH
jgi:sigma-E factor negative regulatory protein RseB